MCVPVACVCVIVSSTLGEHPSLRASWGPGALSRSSTRERWIRAAWMV